MGILEVIEVFPICVVIGGQRFADTGIAQAQTNVSILLAGITKLPKLLIFSCFEERLRPILSQPQSRFCIS